MQGADINTLNSTLDELNYKVNVEGKQLSKDEYLAYASAKRQLQEMDFDKVNIKIDSTAKIPYVKFYWSDYGSIYKGFQIYEKAITRVVIYCKDEDFQPEININNLK